MIRWKPLLSGALTFVAAHLVLVATWRTWFGGGDGFPPWFMNSTAAVAFTSAMFAVVSAFVTARPLQDVGRLESAIVAACYVAAGASAVMAVMLFLLPGGPGSLFPVAIVLGAIVLTAASVAGASAGWLVRIFRR